MSEPAEPMTPEEQPLAASERDAIDALLRAQLGRRMTIAMLALSEAHRGELETLARRLASLDEARVLPLAFTDEGLQEAARLDAEIVLIWLVMDKDEPTAAAILDRAEALGLRERSFVALIGPGMTRARARQMRFEDGFPATTPTDQLLWSLAREAIARDELRRRGSSPPCYL